MSDNVVDLRRVRSRPTSRRQQRLDLLRAAEIEHEAADPVLRAASGATTPELLRAQCIELAREAAALRFERLRAATGARETGRLISRRIRGLRSLARAVVELHELEAGAPSEAVTRRALGLLQRDIEDVVAELFKREDAERLIGGIRRRVEANMDRLLAIR